MYQQGVKKKIVPYPKNHDKPNLTGLSPILQRIFVGRGITDNSQLERGLDKLPSPFLLSGMENMVSHLAQALEQQQKITIVADFDVDGATACAVAVKGLRLLGATNVSFVVPNRFEYGYGLTPEILAHTDKTQHPDLIITVDNGISSIDGVQAANAAGIKVLITDHHLPGDQLPKAAAIVNPNVADDTFPSKNIAGVGVMFYVLLALRSHLRQQKWFAAQDINEPNLAQLLDYVALGTVADVVALDNVNRILVYQGLRRVQAGRACVGISALLTQSGKQAADLRPSDLAFALAPRLNAASRMDDMTMGIQCLLTDDPELAVQIAQQLDDFNQQRKEVEGKMKREAMEFLAKQNVLNDKNLPSGICLFDEDWHQGVVGILASRIKDRMHRPVIAFAPSKKGEIKGSARSIDGVHIRDVLSEVAAAQPKILSKFGGHAMAAGVSLKLHDYPAFSIAFAETVQKHLGDIDLQPKIHSDGQLLPDDINMDLCQQLQNAATWGQKFPEPVFDGEFNVIQCRVVGDQHLKFVLQISGNDATFDAIAFFVDKAELWLGTRTIKTAYQLNINQWRGNSSLQLILQYTEKLS